MKIEMLGIIDNRLQNEDPDNLVMASANSSTYSIFNLFSNKNKQLLPAHVTHIKSGTAKTRAKYKPDTIQHTEKNGFHYYVTFRNNKFYVIVTSEQQVSCNLENVFKRMAGANSTEDLAGIIIKEKNSTADFRAKRQAMRAKPATPGFLSRLFCCWPSTNSQQQKPKQAHNHYRRLDSLGGRSS